VKVRKIPRASWFSERGFPDPQGQVRGIAASVQKIQMFGIGRILRRVSAVV
jgi:hypothetical protein